MPDTEIIVIEALALLLIGLLVVLMVFNRYDMGVLWRSRNTHARLQ